MLIGEQLRKIRKEKKVSMAAMSKGTGLTYPTILNVEKSDYIKSFEKMAAFLGCKVMIVPKDKL